MAVSEVQSYRADDGSLHVTFMSAAEKNITLYSDMVRGLLHKRNNTGGSQSSDMELKAAAIKLVKALEELRGA